MILKNFSEGVRDDDTDCDWDQFRDDADAG